MVRLRFDSDRLDEAEKLVMRAKALFEQAGGPKGVGACCLRAGSIRQERGDVAGAQTAYREGLSLAPSAKDHAGMSRCQPSIGGILEEQADSAGAVAAYRRALDLAEQAGDRA
jgi:tetratricopeptide (TPR) repeat protein